MSPAPTELELQQFFQRDGSRLRGYLATLVGSSDAADLMQETFVRAQRARDTCEASAVAAWVRRIARNVAIDHLRRSAANKVVLGSDELTTCAEGSTAATDPDPERSAIRREMRDCIGDFVRRLPERDAEVIMLAEMRGLPDQEVATALGITLGAAKIRLHRARARLRDMMESGCELYRDEDGLACDRKE
jgi:RNA polymerase sigma-70 factor, ECF subfamily